MNFECRTPKFAFIIRCSKFGVRYLILNMKNCFTTLLFIITAFYFCRAQDTVKMDIPLLLESAKIDSLMSQVIKSPQNLKAIKNDSCLLLSLNKNETFSFIHGVHAINSRETVFSIGNFENQKNAGYFEIAGYLVFVYGDESMNKFFANTHQNKEFTFIKPDAQQNIFVILNYLSLGISYNNGVFSYKAR
jgi:hypothetical protein